ncbi:MAG: squalene/phytoene synthase family protein [Planctomycetota bacterium]
MRDTALIDQLEHWGPEAPPTPPMSEDEAWAYVRELTLGHYENFSVLTRLVPPALRADFAAVYAFCRWSDDLGDETGTDAAARERSLYLLAWWRNELNRCVARAHATDEAPGVDPLRHPVMIMLAGTFRRRATLSAHPFHDLISAFEQDQRVTRYDTWEQLLDYCSRSANPVGRIVLALGGVDVEAPEHADLVRMSDATCTALQLTNFWQDVRRDLLDRDRVYLPSAETGITAEQLRAWIDRPRDADARLAYINALRPLVERTDALFTTGRPLPGELSRRGLGDLARVVWLFGSGGESVLRAVARIGCATLWKRPKLAKINKLALVARAATRRFPSPTRATVAPVLTERHPA